jgi:hypothetical protein
MFTLLQHRYLYLTYLTYDSTTGNRYQYVVSFDPDTGNELSSYLISQQFYSNLEGVSPAITSDSMLHIMSGYCQYYYIFNVSNGIFTTPTIATNLATNHAYCQSVGAPTIAADGTVYLAVDSVVYAYKDNVQKWALTIDLSSPEYSPPSIGANGNIYLCGDLCYSISTGPTNLSATSNNSDVVQPYYYDDLNYTCGASCPNQYVADNCVCVECASNLVYYDGSCVAFPTYDDFVWNWDDDWTA